MQVREVKPREAFHIGHRGIMVRLAWVPRSPSRKPSLERKVARAIRSPFPVLRSGVAAIAPEAPPRPRRMPQQVEPEDPARSEGFCGLILGSIIGTVRGCQPCR